MKFVSGLICAIVFTGACGPTGEERPPYSSNPGSGALGGNTSGPGGAAGGFTFEPAMAGQGGMAIPVVPQSCAAKSVVGERLPLDVFVLLDQSGSMTEGEDRWGPVTAAILGFVDDPTSQGVGVALQYFPLGAQKREDPLICQTSNYETPAVPFAQLPQAAAAVRQSIMAHAFGPAESDTPAHWGTPTRPAVEGVLTYLRAWQAAHADHRTVLLLATDGLPSKLCAKNTISDIAALLRQAATGPMPISTYVIGIGKIDNLQELAQAGATGKPAFVVSNTGGEAIRAEFLAALQTIRKAAVPCAVRIPDAMGAVDLGKVNVELTDAGGTKKVVPRVDGAAACKAGVPAWHFDVADKPSALVMCPSACEQVSSPGARVDVVIGCKTVVVL